MTYEVPPARLEPGTYRNINGNQALALGFVAAASVKRGCRCSRARTRSPRHPISCTSCPSTRTSGSSRSRPRTRSRRSGRHRCRVHRSAGGDDHQRPGHGPQERVPGSGGHGRAAARRRQHPARRAVDRAADQDRAGGPLAGAVRPPRRVAVHRSRRALRRRLLRDRLRGVPPHLRPT